MKKRTPVRGFVLSSLSLFILLLALQSFLPPPVASATEFVISSFRALSAPAFSAAERSSPSVTHPAAPALQPQPTAAIDSNTFPLYLPSVHYATDRNATDTMVATTTQAGVVAATAMTTTIYLSTLNSPDIWAVDLLSDTATLYFDASDVGIISQDINAFYLEDDGSLLFSLDRNKTLPGISEEVDDSDVVRFIPTSLGETTAGSFVLYFDGSDVELTTTGEDIDALSRTPDGRLVISLLGAYAVTGATGDDEDLLVFNATSLGENTTGSWERYLDGVDVGLGDSANEDIHGLWIDPAGGNLYLTTYQDFTTADGLSGDSDDIFFCTPTTLGENSACTFSAFWDGDSHGFANEHIDGIHISGLQGGSGVAAVPVIDPIVDADGDGSYPVTWSTVADAVAYQLEAAPNGAAGTWRMLLTANQTNHTAAAPAAGVWCYRVRANYSDRVGDWSDEVCINAATAGAPPAAPPSPTTTTLYYSTVNSQDIMAVDLATYSTTLFFDTSDTGLFSPDVDAFHLEADGSLLLSSRPRNRGAGDCRHGR
ncbi:MAG: hypothetical protein R2867_15575 [Caldilineaceae bacterium]